MTAKEGLELVFWGAAGIGAVIGAFYALGRVINSASSTASNTFGAMVHTHVKPLVDNLSDSLQGVTDTMREVQMTHAQTTERLLMDLKVKQDVIVDNTSRLDHHDEKLDDHGQRISTVEGRLNA